MNSKPCEDNLSTRATRFHPFVNLFETGRVDGTQVFSERRSQTTADYHCRNFAKEFVLLNHVSALVLRSREHEPQSLFQPSELFRTFEIVLFHVIYSCFFVAPDKPSCRGDGYSAPINSLLFTYPIGLL